jgi:hypothetical protein
MAKVKKTVTVSKCQCSTCQQVSFVEAGKPHFHCNGIKLAAGRELPLAFRHLMHPDQSKKGTWELYIAPAIPMEEQLHIATSEPTESVALSLS